MNRFTMVCILAAVSRLAAQDASTAIERGVEWLKQTREAKNTPGAYRDHELTGLVLWTWLVCDPDHFHLPEPAVLEAGHEAVGSGSDRFPKVRIRKCGVNFA